MVYLAGRAPNQVVSAREIAENQNIPERFLRSIVSQLARQGFVNSVQGNKGGVKLAAGAEHKTLLEVIEAIEGQIYLNVCMQGEDVCQFSDQCTVHLVWREAQDAIQRILGGKTLFELAHANLAHAAGSLYSGTEQMCGVPLQDSLSKT